VIGRKTEQRLLQRLFKSGEAEFVVVYGRRRVGKTYLVREVFDGGFLFSYTGAANVSAKKQLAEFAKALTEQGWRTERGTGEFENWFAAFAALRAFIGAASRNERAVIFIDEMPWMDNKKSDFVPAFEHFWNGWASARKDIMLVVCGSATSWITKKIFRNRGGLYNRVTRQIHLKPFTLAECREYYASRNIIMNTHDMIESYMIFGGIPYYLRLLEGRYSLALNVDALCFAENAPLRGEFDSLFETLFSTPENYMQVVMALFKMKRGLTREDIARAVDFGNGGNLTRILKELEESGFIRRYRPFGKAKNGALYQLTDPFTLFHLNFIRNRSGENFWSSYTDNAGHRAWSGYAFEQVCLAHVAEIKEALGIAGVLTEVSSWRGRSGDKGAQIDMVIDRNDGIVNLCEMKYINGPFEIDKAYDRTLRDKVETFRRETKTKKALHLTMVTTYGVKPGRYADVFQSEITMDKLLKK
jgi:AAA+ ATPase superfamily predicted ATPase